MAAQDSANTAGVAAPASRQALVWATGGYALMILAAIGAFLLIRSYGIVLVAPPAVAPHMVTDTTGPGADVFLHVLLALSAVIITGLILAKGCAYLGQPPVIGEVIAGIVLGPSFLGADASALLLPRTVAPFLGVIAQLGVLLYMFTVGLEFHTDLMRHRTHATVAPPMPVSWCRLCSGRCSPWLCIHGCRAVTCRLRASPSFWGWPCRSPPFLYWHAF